QAIRGERRAEIERRDLISKLMFMPDTENFPLAASGLMPGADAERVRAAFPFYDRDPLHAQAALAFLLLKHRVSVTVTLGPSSTFVFDGGEDYDVALRRGLPPDSIRNPPIAFDFSHQGHRSVQALMWHRMYEVAGGLIELLKGEEWANGQSLWDRSLIYFASDFGRDKRRPANADDWGTGHDLNNGVLLISPLVQGNRVLGGVDEDTGHTYGFNPSDGTPDRARNMEERDLYAGILQSLGVDTSGSGLPDVPAMRRA
ncbi:MAG: hypothetical protein KC620_26335, partial [Myxococcales bacterium]|nr:hypothetical protein [Myxococcales bacterium]